LMLLAILLFFSAKREEYREPLAEADDRPADDDADEAPDRAEADDAGAADAPWGPWQRWREQRQQARMQLQREREAEEERHVDAILMRLHERGMAALSAEERMLLERVSRRYRSRLDR
jgi:hypothetical protein